MTFPNLALFVIVGVNVALLYGLLAVHDTTIRLQREIDSLKERK